MPTDMKQRLLLLFAFFLTISCEEKPYISLDKEMVTFPAEGGEQTIRISSNSPWKATKSIDNRNILTLSQTEGMGDGTITVQAAVNPLIHPRSATVSFICDGGEPMVTRMLTIIQEKALPVAAFLNWEEWTVPAAGGNLSVRVFYNGDWTLTCDNPAVQFFPQTHSQSSYYDSGAIQVSITVPANATADHKTWHIMLNAFDGGQPGSSREYRFFQTGQ